VSTGREPGRQGAAEPSGPPQPPRLLRLALVFYSLLLAGALAIGWASGRSLWFASDDAARRGLDPLRGAGVGLLAGALVVLLSRELTRRTRAGEALARALGRLLGRLSLAECLVLAVLSGVAEEAFFRGALQPLVGLVAASLAFGLVHLVPRRELLPWTGFAVAAGFLLGALFEATGDLVAPIVAHTAVNAVNLRRLSRDYAGEPGA
jgi:membrane protease YdiL (CAAX protease family)